MKKIIIIIFLTIATFIGVVYLSVSETDDNFRTCDILGINDIEKINFKDFDSVTVSANTLYEASLLKQAMQGEQYRKAWSAPITVPIAFLDTLKGGLTIIEEGGGMQTHSLELEDSLGIRYTLRSVSKDPEKLIPEIAKDLGVQNIIVDGISAQHPYAALVVAKLSDAAKIIHTNPKLVFVPKQEVLGRFNTKFGNRLFLFEYESEGEVNWTKLSDIVEILDTKHLQEFKSENGTQVKIDKAALIRARLFDLIIGDWDRHAKQWGWALQKVTDGFMAIPISADRDNAFFLQDGILPVLIANDITYPEIQGFEEGIDFLPGLVSRFDEYFLQNSSREQFLTEASQLKKLLTDSIINASFKVWPKSIDSIDGSEIRKKIIARRNAIFEHAENFHAVLGERPQNKIALKGSEKEELDDKLKECFDCFDLLLKN